MRFPMPNPRPSSWRFFFLLLLYYKLLVYIVLLFFFFYPSALRLDSSPFLFFDATGSETMKKRNTGMLQSLFFFFTWVGTTCWRACFLTLHLAFPFMLQEFKRRKKNKNCFARIFFFFFYLSWNNLLVCVFPHSSSRLTIFTFSHNRWSHTQQQSCTLLLLMWLNKKERE